jgi:hypothetical protein
LGIFAWVIAASYFWRGGANPTSDPKQTKKKKERRRDT